MELLVEVDVSGGFRVAFDQVASYAQLFYEHQQLFRALRAVRSALDHKLADAVCAHHAAGAVRSFEQDYVDAKPFQPVRAREARYPCAYDDHFSRLIAHRLTDVLFRQGLRARL